MGTSPNFRKVKYFLRSLGIHPYALAMWAGQHTTHLLPAAKVCRTMQPCSLLVHFFHIFGSNWCPTKWLASVLAGTLWLKNAGFSRLYVCIIDGSVFSLLSFPENFWWVSLLDCHFAQQVSFLLGFGVLICLKWCMRRFNLYVIRLCKLLNDSSCLYTSTTEWFFGF